jgi:xylulose-5-phosphate/fructose-6-phosphate phosphoketolase
VLARIPEEELTAPLRGYGHEPHYVSGSGPADMHQQMAATLEGVAAEIARIQAAAREGAATGRPRWPMIVLRSPKGWTGPTEVDGRPTEGSWRSHQVPLANLAANPEHLRQLEAWMQSYRPEDLFDGGGALVPGLAAVAPEGTRHMGANPHANGGLLLKDLAV